MTDQRKIKAIIGFGDEPSVFRTGARRLDGKPPVSRIEYSTENFGDHGLGWFDVWCGDRHIFTIAARAVAEIEWEVS